MGLERLTLVINSVGDRKCRPAYIEVLKEYFRPNVVSTCPNCPRRLEENPLQVLARTPADPYYREQKIAIAERPYNSKPYWHVERARIEGTRLVAAEVVVNGRPVALRAIVGDGSIQIVEFEVDIERSSWIALRIAASSHTNPVQVLVGGKPVRASRRSAQWCLDSIDRVWEQKSPRIRESERPDAKRAFDEARAIYRKILDESFDDEDGSTPSGGG